ncbi:YHYH protein [Rubritalea sp.]|uniref:YHYH protein n=1 Tax=Rubritalea sp. TaxID=2109375 RepID=UPI003EF53E08
MKPQISDTVPATVYADNWFKLYINGNLVAVDSISFIPHNVVSVDILPEYPLTIAVMAKDNADPKTGLEYNNSKIGDGGFILKFGDGTVTDASWKAKSFFRGPVNGKVDGATTEHLDIPNDWMEAGFDDSKWGLAVEHSEKAVSPKAPYYENDFEGAKWIWTDDLALDNTVIFRKVVESPPNGNPVPQKWPRGVIDASEKESSAKTFSEESHETSKVNVKPFAAHFPGKFTLESATEVPEMVKAFLPYKDQVGISWDEDYVYIEGNGLPMHPMMKGIKAWQQQVPLPHDFTGEHRFKLPLTPKVTEGTPQELTLKGPIALAVNGVPIFHALTQSGNDAYAAGELDEWGGHCGRADDYHYHIAPAHLEETVGKGNPVAFGMDGHPVYLANPSIDKPLDSCHGYFDSEGQYRYIGNLKPPYVMAYFRGEADLADRPRTIPVRPFLRPLRGATITEFSGSLEDGFSLRYSVDGKEGEVDYKVTEKGADFVFKKPNGEVSEESYERYKKNPTSNKFPLEFEVR